MYVLVASDFVGLGAGLKPIYNTILESGDHACVPGRLLEVVIWQF